MKKYICFFVFACYLGFVSTLFCDIGQTVSVVITARLAVSQVLMRIFIFVLGFYAARLWRSK